MIKNYDAKFAYLLCRQHGICLIAKAKDGWAEAPTSLHHRLSRSKWAKKKFPLFIDSVWNLMAVNHDWHMKWPGFGRISFIEANDREAFLERHPAIAQAVNFEED